MLKISDLEVEGLYYLCSESTVTIKFELSGLRTYADRMAYRADPDHTAPLGTF